MATRRNKLSKRKRSGLKQTKKMRGGKKWKTAIQAAQSTLKQTGSLEAAQKTLKAQALANARKLFGSIDKI